MEDQKNELRRLLKSAPLFNESSGRYTTFKIGGRAKIYVEAQDEIDLRNTIKFCAESKTKFFILGNGSNILISDQGFDGVLIKLSSAFFKNISVNNEILTAGAGSSVAGIIKAASDAGLGALEMLAGIPACVGGAVYMNAGINPAGLLSEGSHCIGELVDEMKVMDYNGHVFSLERGDLRFSYRHSGLENLIILSVKLRLKKRNPMEIKSLIRKYIQRKLHSQDLSLPSAGCIFKNPKGGACGKLIDMCGLKGASIGGAMISNIHANFIVNYRSASAKDVLELIEFTKQKVFDKFNITLEEEIRYLN